MSVYKQAVQQFFKDENNFMWIQQNERLYNEIILAHSSKSTNKSDEQNILDLSIDNFFSENTGLEKELEDDYINILRKVYQPNFVLSEEFHLNPVDDFIRLYEILERKKTQS